MTLTFPLQYKFVSTDFDLAYNNLATPNRAGRLQRMEFAPPRWKVSVNTTNMSNNDLLALRAWWDSLEGGVQSFFISDQARPRPAHYATLAGMTVTGGGAFDGTCDVVSYPTTKSIALENLPANFVFKTGDYLGLEQGENRSLHRITGDVTATGSGTVTVNVVPYVAPAVFTAAAIVRLEKPVIKAVPVAGSWQGAPQIFHGAAGFSAVQLLF